MQLYIQLHNAFVWNKQLLKTNGLFGYCYFWHFYSKYSQCLSISITLNCFMYFNLENLHCIVVYKLWQIALMHVYITVLRIFLKRFIQSFWPKHFSNFQFSSDFRDRYSCTVSTPTFLLSWAHAEMCKRQGNFPTLLQVIYQGLENYMKDAAFWLLHELDTLKSKRGNH